MDPDNRIPDDVLSDQWNSFRLKIWRRLHESVRDAKAGGLTQKEIAERIGMNEAQLSRILSGRSNVTIRTMHNIARAIGYRPEIEFVELKHLTAANTPMITNFRDQWLSGTATASRSIAAPSPSSQSAATATPRGQMVA